MEVTNTEQKMSEKKKKEAAKVRNFRRAHAVVFQPGSPAGP